MKKLLAILIIIVCVLTLVFTFASCGNKEPKIEGRYYLQSLMFDNLADELPGIRAVINKRTEYDCVVGGEMDFSQFYLEFKNGKMTIHGSWEIIRDTNYMFVLFPKGEVEYSYQLKKSETNSERYDLYIDDGTSSVEPYCSFSPASKYNSAHIFRQYLYGCKTADTEEYITCNYYLEGSSELSK